MPAVSASPWLSTYESREDLRQFGDNAIGLFALALRYNLEDLVATAAESITDGSDDKKCDLIYIGREDKVAVVAQCYVATTPKSEAKANKASDLNTAIGWLLQSDINDLPDRIRFQAIELREAIRDGSVGRILVWYVHNCPEASNVAAELKIVEATGQAAIQANFPGSTVDLHAREVGYNTLDEWYRDTQSPILVNDNFTLEVSDGFTASGPDWEALVISIPLTFLRDRYAEHDLKLFSANVRDYLGSISSEANINNGIKRTAVESPKNFWAYNNGVTILVNSFDLTESKGRKIVNFSGMSIINGAQTTGAISSVDGELPSDAHVSARLVKTSDAEVLYDIIRYNNSQNKVAASDFRSTDPIQKRLKKDMEKIPSAEYDGGRRGGPTDAIKRRPNLLASHTVGQALAAMHGDATIAYNQKSEIWINDGLYSRYFNEQTTASHIVFAYALLRAVEDKKNALTHKSNNDRDNLTESELKQLEFFRRRGSTFLFVSAMAACLEVFLNRKVPNIFRLSFGVDRSPSQARAIWASMVDLNVPLSSQLEEAFTHGLQNQEKLKAAIGRFTSIIEVTATPNRETYRAFADAVVSQ